MALSSGSNFWASLRALLGTQSDKFTDPWTQNPFVRSAVSALYRIVRGVPLRGVTGKRGVEGDDAPKPIGDDAPLSMLLSRPNPWQTGPELAASLVAYRKLEGVAYALVYGEGDNHWTPDRKTIPREICPIDPRTVSVAPNGRDLASGMIRTYEVQSGLGTVRVAAESMLVFRDFNPRDLQTGSASLASVWSGMTADMLADVYAAAMLENDGTPGVMLKLKALGTKDQMDALRSTWDDRHKGARKARRTAVIGPDMDVVPAPAQTAKDMETPALRAWYRDAVKAVLGVTDFEVGRIADYNRANSESARVWLWQNTILPELSDIEDVLWSRVFEPSSRGQRMATWAAFDLSKVEALKPQLAETATTAEVLIRTGFDPEQVADKLDLGLDFVELPDVPDDTAEPDAPNADAAKVAVQSEGLNGAQVAAVLQVLAAVSAGTLKPEAAILTIATAFPMIPEATARRIVAGALAAPTPDPVPTPPAAKSFNIITRDAPKHAAPVSIAVALRLHRAWQRHAELVLGVKWRKFTATRYAETIAAARNLTELGPLNSTLERILGTPSEWRAGAETAAKVVVKLGKPLAENLSLEVGGFSRIEVGQLDFAATAGKRVAQMVKVGEKLRGRIRDSVIRGMEQGDAPDVATLEKMLEQRFGGVLPSNAAVVARTETGMYASEVRQSLMVRDGIDDKLWSATNDQWTRETHLAVNGQERPVNERFSNGLLHPLEAGAPASEVIQCRCVALPLMRSRGRG